MINRNYQIWTRIFIGIIVGLILVYDVYIMIVGGTGTTISHELIVWAYKYPVMPFAIGFTMGHLFWRMPSTKDTGAHDEHIQGLLAVIRKNHDWHLTSGRGEYFASKLYEINSEALRESR